MNSDWFLDATGNYPKLYPEPYRQDSEPVVEMTEVDSADTFEDANTIRLVKRALTTRLRNKRKFPPNEGDVIHLHVNDLAINDKRFKVGENSIEYLDA